MGDQRKGDPPPFTSITRKTLLILINFLMMSVIGVISWKFVATYMPPPLGGIPNEVGTVASAISFIGLFSFLTNLGFGASHVKKVSEGEDLGKCIGTFFTIQVISVTVLVVVVIGAILFWKYALGKGFETPRFEYTVYLLLGYYIANNLSTVGLQTFVAKIEIAKNQIVVLIGSFVQLVVTIIVVLNTDDLYVYAATFVVGAMVNLFISFGYLTRYPIKPPSWRLFKGYFAFSLPLFLVSVLATLTPNIDKIMIQLFWDSSNVAIYLGGQKFSAYLITISTGLGMILFPTFSAMKAKGMRAEIRDLIRSSERLIVMIMGPLCAIIFALSLPIVTIFGTGDYSASYLVLQPLTIWGFLKSLNAPYSNLMMGIGKPWVLAVTSIIGVGSIVLLNLIFIPKDIQLLGITLLGMGPRGAAIATMISVVVTNLIFRLFAYRYEGVFFNTRTSRFIIASLITGGVIFTFVHFFPVHNFFVLVAYAGAGMLLYLALLIVMRAFDKEDRAQLLNILSPSLMGRYIKDELMNRNDERH
ncbi:MAG: oligosaccharide flippase family protein [Candidatus Thermoplasmatota archaeon]|nr:oligosaccharide flippase family protein [Candidatus Thermoplasmatota archaeon]